MYVCMLHNVISGNFEPTKLELWTWQQWKDTWIRPWLSFHSFPVGDLCVHNPNHFLPKNKPEGWRHFILYFELCNMIGRQVLLWLQHWHLMYIDLLVIALRNLRPIFGFHQNDCLSIHMWQHVYCMIIPISKYLSSSLVFPFNSFVSPLLAWNHGPKLNPPTPAVLRPFCLGEVYSAALIWCASMGSHRILGVWLVHSKTLGLKVQWPKYEAVGLAFPGYKQEFSSWRFQCPLASWSHEAATRLAVHHGGIAFHRWFRLLLLLFEGRCV